MISRRTYRSLGKPMPLHAGSPGKLLLAFLPPSESRKALREESLTAFTPRTIVDMEALAAELCAIRRRGYAISSSEHSPGITSISCPIRNRLGAVIAAINIWVPLLVSPRPWPWRTFPRSVDLTNSVSRVLGYEGPLHED